MKYTDLIIEYGGMIIFFVLLIYNYNCPNLSSTSTGS